MENLIDDLLLEIEEGMENTLSHYLKELSGLRTGKASPALVDSIQVEAYGSVTRLKDIAGISAPEPRLLVVQPWDPGVVDSVIKAIAKANIGITPLKDGKIIRIPIPELSAERRGDLKKLAKKMAEEGRIGIRNLRRDANDKIKKNQKSSSITEDERHSAEKEIQDLTDKFIQKIDASLEKKETELETI